MGYSFTYGVTNVQDLIVTESRRAASGKLTVNRMQVDHQAVVPTPRFWTSFFHRYGVSESVFRYFQPVEVFNRIAERVSNDELRYCVEQRDRGPSRLLAVSNQIAPLFDTAKWSIWSNVTRAWISTTPTAW